MADSHFDFVNVVVADRDLVVTSAYEHACRLEPRGADLAWYCDLDDGTSTDNDHDPASFVRWVCPALRGRRSTTRTAVLPVDVHRLGPHSDLGRLIKRFARLTQRASRPTPEGDSERKVRLHRSRWDPRPVDPPAQYDDGVLRPAELWSIKITGEGLVVASVSLWDSAPALDHQLGLALDIAHRLTAHR